MDNKAAPIYTPLNVKKNDRLQFFCLNASCKAEKLIAFIKENTNEKGYINFQIKEKRQPDQFGNTHSVTLDTWQPKPQESGPREAEARWPKGKQPIQSGSDQGESDPVPF